MKPLAFDLPPVVGIYSPTPRSGKSVVAAELYFNFGYSLEKFAACLKGMATLVLTGLGMTTEQARDVLEDDRKDRPLALLNGRTPRHLLQTLGTEWGRDMIYPELWVDIAKRTAFDSVQKLQRPVVFDDMRFPNEFDMVKDIGGYTIKIVRPHADGHHRHASEGALDEKEFDLVIYNGSTLESLREQLQSNFVRCATAKQPTALYT